MVTYTRTGSCVDSKQVHCPSTSLELCNIQSWFWPLWAVRSPAQVQHKSSFNLNAIEWCWKPSVETSSVVFPLNGSEEAESFVATEMELLSRSLCSQICLYWHALSIISLQVFGRSSAKALWYISDCDHQQWLVFLQWDRITIFRQLVWGLKRILWCLPVR